MTTVQKLKNAVKAHFPSATFEEDSYPSGKTWLDIRLGGALFVVELGQSGGFGISTAHEGGIAGFGEGPDRVFTRYPAAERHLLALLGGTGVERRRAGRQPPRRKGSKAVSPKPPRIAAPGAAERRSRSPRTGTHG
jgi:hypothetical protein